MGERDPARVVYNALVPFAVASLEHFFSQTFKIFMAYDHKAKERVKQEKRRKVEMADLLAVREGTKSVEDIIADWYSFQNIDSIHHAFNEWLSIDFWKILRNGKVPDDNLTLLDEALNRIIEFRHGIIHRYDIDRRLDHKQTVAIFDTAIAVIDEFVKYFEQKRGVSVRDVDTLPC